MDAMARRSGIPYLEYACMPLGELSDLLDFYAEAEGGCYTVSVSDQQYIPEVR